MQAFGYKHDGKFAVYLEAVAGEQRDYNAQALMDLILEATQDSAWRLVRDTIGSYKFVQVNK